MVCKNCYAECSDNYCSNCGQRSSVKRLDLPYMRDQIVVGLFQLERGIVYTIVQLLTRPGHSIREYIEGKRVKHFKPFAFLFVAATIYVIANKILGHETAINDFLQGFYGNCESCEGDEAIDKAGNTLTQWINNYQVYVILISILLFSIASYFAFSRFEYNLIEHLVLNFYIAGFQLLMYTIFSLFPMDEDSMIVLIPFVVGMIFNGYTYFQFFRDKSWGRVAGSLLLAYCIFLVFLVFTVVISSFFFPDTVDW